MRYVLGPSFKGTRPGVAVPVPGAAVVATAKTDIATTVVGVDEVKWTVSLQVPAYDLTKSHQLMVVRAYLVPVASVPPATADEYVNPGPGKPAFKFVEEDVSSIQTGVVGELQLPTVPPGDYIGQIVHGFAS